MSTFKFADRERMLRSFSPTKREGMWLLATPNKCLGVILSHQDDANINSTRESEKTCI